jgi:hypothetical protein
MKILVITFFNIKVIIHFELIQQGQTVNQVYYVEVLKHLHAGSDWILHHDSASAKKVLSVKQILAQKSITETEYPPCSLDLASDDFWLFP